MATVTLSRGGSTLAQVTLAVNQPSVAQFDGRAANFPGVFPTTSGSGQTVIVSPTPPMGWWDGYTYMGNDCTIVADPAWGKAYRFAPPSGDHNPGNLNAPKGSTSAQITKRRPISLGQTYYWANSIRVESFTFWPDFGSIMSLGYETVDNDQLQLGIYSSTGGQPNSWCFGQTCGLVNATTGRGAVQYVTSFAPVVLGQYVDFVVGAHIADDNTGWAQVHMRPNGGSWSQVFSKTGVPTTVWQNATGTPIVPSTTLDKEGIYVGNWSDAQTPAPTGVLYTRGHDRFTTLADAKASLG